MSIDKCPIRAGELAEKICTPTSACNEKFIRTPKLCSPRKVRQRFVYRILLSFYVSFSLINRSLFVDLTATCSPYVSTSAKVVGEPTVAKK